MGDLYLIWTTLGTQAFFEVLSALLEVLRALWGVLRALWGFKGHFGGPLINLDYFGFSGFFEVLSAFLGF